MENTKQIIVIKIDATAPGFNSTGQRVLNGKILGWMGQYPKLDKQWISLFGGDQEAEYLDTWKRNVAK